MKKDGAQPQAEDFFTVEDYLAFESSSEIRNEYISGRIVAMTGASREHNLINGNISSELRNQLRGKPCETYSNDMRVETKAFDYYYPDTLVVCGEPEIVIRQGVDTLLNPTVIIEVLSKRTELKDRGDKFIEYRGLESLKDYILISQNKMRVEHYTRQPNNEWILHRDLTSPTEKLTIQSIGCEILLSAIYERVKFPAERQLRRVTEDDEQQ